MATKEYNLNIYKRNARPRSKRLRESGMGGTGNGGSTVVNVSGSGNIESATDHTHANKNALDQITTDADGYLYLTQNKEVQDDEGNDIIERVTEKVKAGYADKAHDLDEDSPVNDRFLSALADDIAEGNITFKKTITVIGAALLKFGAKFGNYAAGATGANIDKEGNAELLSLLLRGALRVGNYIEKQTGGKIDSAGDAELASLFLRGVFEVMGDSVFHGDIKSHDYATGALGAGYGLVKDSNGDSYLEIDRLLVRKIAYFVELVIQRMSHVGGQIILTPASMKCVKVEEHDDYYRCYFESTDGDKEITNDFVVGDQARCQTFNIKAGTSQNVSNSYYWRLVVGVGDDYIDLSKTDCDAGSTVPQADDEIVLLGNRTDATRQAAIVLASYGNDAPYIKLYRGINSYQLSGKEFISFSRTQIKMIADELYFSTGESVSTVINGVKSDLEETKTEFQGKIDTVDSKVEGIQIGVRNLLLKSNVEISNQETYMGKYIYSEPLSKGKEYTLTLCYTLGANGTSIGACFISGDVNMSFTTHGEKVVEQKSYTIPEDAGVLSSCLFYQYGATDSKIHWAVLVEGNKAPNMWVAAPEDMEEQLQTVSGTVTTLSSELTNTKEALESYKDEVEVKFTSAATATEEQIENAVLNLQKGMRNLVKQGLYNIVGSTEYYIKAVLLTKELVPGSVYTIVLKATILGTQFLYVIDNYGSYGQIRVYPADLVNGIFVGSFEYAPDSRVTNHSQLQLYNYPSSGSAANPMDLEWVCLYEGDITDTAPDYFVNAPEDLNLEINSVKQSVSAIEQTAENISLRVTTTETKVNETLPQEIEDALTDAKDYTADRTLPTWRGWIDVTQDADGNPLDENKYYPLTIRLYSTDYTNIRLKVSLNSGTTPSWSTHNKGFTVNCEWNAIGSGWGVNPEPLREIIDYSRAFTNTETLKIDNEDVTRTIEPVASIGQLTQYGYEYIYLRGGGKYYFEIQGITYNSTRTEFAAEDIQLHTTTFVPSSSYPDYKIEVLTPEDITIIERTNVTKTEYTAEIEALEDAINLRVTKTDYDANNVALNQQIGQLETSYNSINGTVSSLNTRLGVLEESGFIVQDDFVTLFSQQLSESGAEIASAINITPNGITLQSEKVEFVSNDGAMKFFGKDLYEPLDMDFDGFAGVDIDIDAIAGGSTEVINVNNVFKVSSRGDFFFGVKNGNYIEYYAGGRLQNSAGVGSDIPAQFIINVDTLNIRGGSINFNNGVFKVDSNGAMTATEANITGTVDATYLNATQGGIIGGFTISENYLMGSKFRLSGGQLRFQYDGHEVYLGGHPIQAPSSGGTGVILGSFVTDGGSESFGLHDDIALYAAAKVDRDVNFALWTNGYVRMQNLIGGTTDGMASTYKKVGMIMADTGQNSAGWCMLRVYRG